MLLAALLGVGSLVASAQAPSPSGSLAVAATGSRESTGTPSEESTVTSPIALIYNGKVAAEGCPEALAELVEALGMKVVYFDNPSKLPKRLKGATFCMIGGTEDDLSPLLKQFKPKIRSALTKWVRAGGVYVGTCGGGYVASKGWDESWGTVKALALVPVWTEAWVENPDPMIITVTWNGTKRTIYYQYGPVFLVKKKHPGIKVIARYSDKRPAVLVSNLGKGRVVVCGPHPEADETWLEDDPPPTHASRWRPTRDLALALLRSVLPTAAAVATRSGVPPS